MLVVSRRSRSLDLGIGAAFALAVLFVQPLGVLFRRPFWVDEAWVADLVKVPLSRQVALSSSTPIGWALLLRLVPGHGTERLRVVPLLFSVAAVVVAFRLARGLNWRSPGEARAAGVIAGAAVLLAPISLQQNDLKQYTADAALALLVFVVAREADRRPGRRALVLLGVVSVVAVPFSTVAVFVGAAAFAGLLGAAAFEQQWRRVRDVLFTGCAAGVASAAYAAIVVLPHQNRALREYWRPFYLDGSPWHIVSTAGHRFLALRSTFGVAPVLVVAFFVAGLLVLGARRSLATAISAVVLWLEMLALGVVDRYPFLDPRTSHFLLIVTLTIAAIGFSGVASEVARRRPLLLAVVVIVAIGGLAFGARHQIRTFQFPVEDVRVQTLYVAQHHRANDVVVVNLLANWGFTYYWRDAGTRVFVARPAIAAGYIARVDGINGVFAGGRRRADAIATLQRALAERRALGGRGRIWIVRTHLIGGDSAAWSEAFTALHLHPVSMTGGPEPLLAVNATSP
jgi:hypothetical protein